jgi:hypothetical protein
VIVPPRAHFEDRHLDPLPLTLVGIKTVAIKDCQYRRGSRIREFLAHAVFDHLPSDHGNALTRPLHHPPSRIILIVQAGIAYFI